MVPGNWGITVGPQVEWLSVAVLENYVSPEALAHGPLTNETVTGRGVLRTSRVRSRARSVGLDQSSEARIPPDRTPGTP